MYISRVVIKDIKCFHNVTIDFRSNKDVCMWGVVLGDNGLGKTTVLQSIAMSLAGKTSASGLMDELYGEWIRTGELEGSIHLELVSGDKNRETYSITTTFKRKTLDGAPQLEQTTKPKKKFPWDDIFVCGYGAGRGVVFGSQMGISEYSVTDSVYSLFNYEARLQNPELTIRRITHGLDDAELLLTRIMRWIDHILMLPEGSTALNRVGLNTSGFWGPSMPAAALGDGHKATISWLGDMLGWVLLYDESMFRKEISGVVLIDEIEQHLHPSWQKAIIKRIRNCFPKVQFIITTHSPLCAIGTTDLRDDECTLALLTLDETGASSVQDKLKPPRGRRADQVLTSYLFGLTTSGDNATIHKIERYSDLMSRERRHEEEQEAQILRCELEQILGTKETELQQEVAQAVREVLERKLESCSIDPKLVDLEIKRQLRELFGDDR